MEVTAGSVFLSLCPQVGSAFLFLPVPVLAVRRGMVPVSMSNPDVARSHGLLSRLGLCRNMPPVHR